MSHKKSDTTLFRKGKFHLSNEEFDCRVPGDRPNFTLDDIKNAIPKHCFERPFLKSFSYVVHDFVICTLIFCASLFIQQLALKIAFWTSTAFGFSTEPLQAILDTSFLKTVENPASFTFALPSSFTALFGESAGAFFSMSPMAGLSHGSVFVYNTALTALWVGYFLLQGVFMTGLWVLGHECGHRGFHATPAVSDTVGLILHSFLLVPYHSWRISHRTHHSHTGDLELDEVHNPFHVNAILPSAAHGFLHNDKWEQEKDAKTKKDLDATFVTKSVTFVKELDHVLRDVNFVYRCISGFLMGFIGWILYLLINASGRRYPASAIPPNHFLPSSPIFKKEEAGLVILSDIALACYFYLFYRTISAFGFAFFFMSYIVPYFVTNYWLVMITFLQHTHPSLPHFTTKRWNYVQGSLSTVDRNYGWFLNTVFHNIQDTHVTHHLFSYIPHYHAAEATAAVKKVVGKYYVKTEEENDWFGVLRSIWYCLTHMNFVAEDNHPAIVLAETAIEARKRGADPVKAVEAKKDEALANGPHVNGRNVDAEVFWFRTVNY